MKTRFKFNYIRNQAGYFFYTRTGLVEAEQLVLNGEPLRYEHVLDTTHRDNRLVIVVDPNAPLGKHLASARTENSCVVLELSGIKADELERHIDAVSSAKHAEARRQELKLAGEADHFRCTVCPQCNATIDLTDYQVTPSVYCRYCESIFSANDRQVLSVGARYRVCDECGMHGRVKGHTEAYFYFLLVVWGYRYQRRHICDDCADSIANKCLLYNLPFVLGMPSAIWMKIQANTGRDPALQHLARANVLAKKGKWEQADPIYNEIVARAPNHPGYLFNQSLGHLIGKNPERGLELLGRSLHACSNYHPSLALLTRLEGKGA